LLADDEDAHSFLETPAAMLVGIPAVPDGPAFVPGQKVGPYTVVAPAGAGGMGEVYRVWDPRLQRDIALKVLPGWLSDDPTRRQQFEVEARAAAALDHPNICSVHDIGEQRGHVWIAMQFIDGETLAARLRSGAFEPRAAVDVAVQIVEALVAAHERGIIHRDIKPHNIMVIGGRQVKVLDFGLAQIVSGAAPVPGRAQETASAARQGTLAYMSPEQVRGEPLDARTDIFSFGAVLFELVTGRRAFLSETGADPTDEILFSPLPDLARFVPWSPGPLNAVVQRCLQKNREHRYRDARELANDLASVRSQLTAVSTGRATARRRMGAAGASMIAVGALAAWLQPADVERITPQPTLQFTQLTNFPDSVHSPALSADGSLLAFVRGAAPWEMSGGGGEIYVKALPDGQPVALTSTRTLKAGLTFTPDASRIVFTDTTADDSSFSVPTGGGPTTLFKRNASGLRWIGQGELLFSEMRTPPNMGVVTASGEGEPRDVYFPTSRTGMAHFSERSPDGRYVLVIEMENAIRLPCRVIPFDGSSQGRRVGPAESECTSAAWSPEGNWMYFSAIVNGESHLWRQRFPDGQPEQMTFGPNQENGVAVDPDGRSVITSVGAQQSTVWYHDERGDRPLSVEGYSYRPLVSPDARKVFYLVRRGTRRSFAVGELWAADLATGRNERVLPGLLIRSYHLSPDGRFVVFDAFDRSDRSRLWLAAMDASEPPRRLTPEDGPQEQRPFFGALGHVYFMQEQSPGVQSLYRMKPDGSERHELLADIDFLVNVAPDEKGVVLWRAEQGMSFVTFGDRVERPLCSCGLGPIYPDSPSASWSGDSKTFFLFADGRTVLIPVGHGDRVPAVTPFRQPHAQHPAPSVDVASIPGATIVPERSTAPGPTLTQYAFVRQARQSNLYRISLP
jgi:serine/threonine protein kinase/dipeptidyl aminopeptidase/acylaminoacyl peptidase